MKLELRVKGRLWDSVELSMPPVDEYLPFQANCKVREEYVKWMVESLKNRYKEALELKEWEIVMVAESSISEIELEEVA